MKHHRITIALLAAITALAARAQGQDIITFADPVVKRICVEHWDTNGDGELSKQEAAAVRSIEYVFNYQGGNKILSFDEFRNFTGVTQIGDYAFSGCTCLMSVSIPNSVTSIGESAFFDCESLTTVHIPNSVTYIGETPFAFCINLSNIILPNSLTTIGDKAFLDCRKLEKVQSYIELPFPISDEVFSNNPASAALYVPKGTKAKYEATEGWKNFKNIVEMEGEEPQPGMDTDHRAEYFVDSDPGFGLGTAIGEVEWTKKDYQLQLDGVKPGAHILYVRAKDDEGRWSSTASAPLYVRGYEGFWRMEYFYDGRDPGQGKATAMARPLFSIGDMLAELPTTGLSVGTHTLSVRGMRQDGTWSDVLTRPFLVAEHAGPPQPEQRGNLEYFYDTDPGYGNGRSVVAMTGENRLAFDLGDLKPGAHILYVRAKDDEGCWSATASAPLYVCHQIDITAMEYFFDSTDPGQGRATAVALPAKHSAVVAFQANTSGLAAGRHQLNVRTRDSEGQWSLLSSESFTITEAAGITTVVADFGFSISMHEGKCTITQQENCQRNDCHVTITDLAGRQLAAATWPAGQPQLLLPVTATTQVVIVKITDNGDHRQFVRRIIVL